MWTRWILLWFHLNESHSRPRIPVDPGTARLALEANIEGLFLPPPVVVDGIVVCRRCQVIVLLRANPSSWHVFLNP